MAQLPPKIPITATLPRTRPNCSSSLHRNSTSLSFLPSEVDDNSCCVDDFLNFSTLKRDSHRRSISDSAAVFGPERLLSVFNDPSTTPSSDKKHGLVEGLQQLETTVALEHQEDNKDDALKETRKTWKVDKAAGASDQIEDSKRVKRILANRQSAQKSRVKKLQYIMQLERSLTSLQMEVSALSPCVAYLGHQRSVLTMDNAALRQRIVDLAQDKIFKDAHQESLKKEVERLRQVYDEQNTKSTDSRAHQIQPPSLSFNVISSDIQIGSSACPEDELAIS